MKRFIHTLLVVLVLHVLLPSVSAHGQEVVVGGMKYVIFQGHAVLAECLKDDVGELVIPETVSCDETDYPVTEIGGQVKEDDDPYHSSLDDPHPFQNCETVTSVKCPKSLNYIGIYAFQGCKNLRRVDLPEDVNLGPRAFANCTSLRKVLIPTGCRMGESTFGYCTLDTVEYASGSKTSDNWAFYGSTIEAVVVPQSVESLPRDWLYGTDGVGSIILFRKTPPAYHVRGYESDKNMENAMKAVLYVPYGTAETYRKHEDWGLFDKIFELPDTIHFEEPDTVSTVDSTMTIVDGMQYMLFRNHAVLTKCLKEHVGNLVIPEAVSIGGKSYPVTSVGGQTEYVSYFAESDGHNIANDSQPFAYCRTITSVTFPQSVTYIGQGAFISCENLRSISLPETVELGQHCFAFCNSLKNVVIPKGAVMSTDRVWNGSPFWFCCLDTLEFMAGRESIDGEAWLSQGSAQVIIVPSTVKSIYRRWLFGTEYLGNLITYADTPPEYNISEFYEARDNAMFSWQWQSLENAMKANLIVPDGALEAYKNHKDWGLYEHIYTDLATGIAQLQVGLPPAEKGKSLNRIFFDLTGRQLAAPPRRGVYIQDGRKRVR
jgi:hypothetical protein